MLLFRDSALLSQRQYNSNMSENIPTNPDNIKWLSLQDLLRRRAQTLEHSKMKLYVVGLAIALVIPLTSLAGKKLGVKPDISSAIVGILALTGLAIEFCGQFVKSRMAKLHCISRRALATVLPADASGNVPPQERWNQIRDQANVSEQEVADWATQPKNQKRFAKWWASNRAPGTPGRLRALLLDNVIWTQAILNKMVAKKTRWRLVMISGFIFLLLCTAILAPNGLPGIIEYILVPLLLFALALNGLNTTDLEVWADARDEINAIHNMLHGIDGRADQDSLGIALLGRYLGLTSAIPPVSTEIYDEELAELDRRTQHEAIETYLAGRG
jgi:hypothetical protein